MSKKIDYDKIVRDSFAKAQRDLGLIKEAETFDPKDFAVYGGGKRFGTQQKAPSPSDLAYFTARLRQFAGVSTGESGKVSISNLKQILKTLNEILGFEEAKIGGEAAGYIRSKEQGSTDVSRITTALFLASTLNSIINEQVATSAGTIWEGFVANLLLGNIPSDFFDRPIQDVVDEQGNYISVKLIKEGGLITGSKANLAIAIEKMEQKKGAGNGKVYYLVCVKSAENNPVTIKFYLFEINKENYFQFILANSKVISPDGTISSQVVDEIKKMKEIKVDPTLVRKPAGKEEDVKDITAFRKSADEIYLEKAKQLSGGDPKKEKQEIVNIKNYFRDQIDKLADSVEANRAIFFDVFKEFIKDGKLQYPGMTSTGTPTYQPILLDNAENFKTSMKNFWIQKDNKEDTIFKQTAYGKFVQGMIERYIKFPNYIENDINTQINIANLYDINEEDSSKIPELKAYDDKLLKMNKELASILGDEQSKALDKDYFRKLIASLANFSSGSNVQKQNYEVSIRQSFRRRMNEIYHEKHNIMVQKFSEVMRPFFEWFEQQKLKAKSERAAFYKNQYDSIKVSSKASLSKEKILGDFWNHMGSLEQSPSEKRMGTFEVGVAAASKFSDVDDDFEEIVLSKIEIGEISKNNEELFKTYIKPYYQLLAKIKESSNKYFAGDDVSGIKEADESLQELRDVISKGPSVGKTYKKETGDDYKKASELRESLKNMTKEARMVMEMLKRMED